jgi:hypothetical protein
MEMEKFLPPQLLMDHRSSWAREVERQQEEIKLLQMRKLGEEEKRLEAEKKDFLDKMKQEVYQRLSVQYNMDQRYIRSQFPQEIQEAEDLETFCQFRDQWETSRQEELKRRKTEEDQLNQRMDALIKEKEKKIVEEETNEMFKRHSELINELLNQPESEQLQELETEAQEINSVLLAPFSYEAVADDLNEKKEFPKEPFEKMSDIPQEVRDNIQKVIKNIKEIEKPKEKIVLLEPSPPVLGAKNKTVWIAPVLTDEETKQVDQAIEYFDLHFPPRTIRKWEIWETYQRLIVWDRMMHKCSEWITRKLAQVIYEQLKDRHHLPDLQTNPVNLMVNKIDE